MSFGRRLIHACVAALLITTATPGVGTTAPTDVDKAAKILQNSDDYRLRLGAALTLGNSGDFKARKPLEAALIDPHPSVRQAAASALAKLGDVLAISALEERLKKESNAPTKTAIGKAVTELKSLKASGNSVSGASGGSTTSATGGPDWAKTKYVVVLQKMSNGTGIRPTELANVLGESARVKFSNIAGVYVVPVGTNATAITATALQQGVP
ncbi:MAG: HEAT repeat domain-containing protein, partial [Polyangiales bacterium]